MAFVQQRQQEIHDKHRNPAPAYQIGDKVWLDMRNVRLPAGRKRKFTRLHEQFTITGIVGNNAYRLDTPNGMYNVFHTSLMRPVAQDPFPSQQQDDVQPAPVLVEGENEYGVEAIADTRVKRGRGRGGPLRREFLVKWSGYAEPTWEPMTTVADTVALDNYEATTGRDFATEPLVLEGPPQMRGRRGVL